MKKYTFGACDWQGRLVELSIIDEDKARAGKVARGILEGAREFIDIDEGISLNNEEVYQ